MSARRGSETKYTPLVRFLATLPVAQQSVTLTFTELEALLSAPLPASAWTTPFWASDPTARRHWRQQHWLGCLDRPQRSVTFTRLREPRAPTPRRPIDRDAIIAAYHLGATIVGLAGQFGVIPPTIDQLLRHTGVPRHPRRKGARHGYNEPPTPRP